MLTRRTYTTNIKIGNITVEEEPSNGEDVTPIDKKVSFDKEINDKTNYNIAKSILIIFIMGVVMYLLTGGAENIYDSIKAHYAAKPTTEQLEYTHAKQLGLLNYSSQYDREGYVGEKYRLYAQGRQDMYNIIYIAAAGTITAGGIIAVVLWLTRRKHKE